MKTKDQVQKEAVNSIVEWGYRGLILAATGVGKSKIAIDWLQKYMNLYPYGNNYRFRFLIVVPTEKLRDQNWKEEFEKWNCGEIYNKYVDKKCYASINKISMQYYDVVIFDEVHNITELNSKFFEKNQANSAIALTATYPRDSFKQRLITRYFGQVIYEVSLDEAVAWGLVAPYKINVVLTQLDSSSKVVRAGSKDKPFYTTEKQAYDYISGQISTIEEKYREKGIMYQSMWEENDKSRINMLRIQRMKNFNSSYSKGNVASFILNKVIPKEDRTIIFCGDIDQANSLCAYSFHSKSNDKFFNQFINQEINKLSCVGKLNEGINVPNVDNAIITQVNSNELDLIQRIGRVIRFREGHVGVIWIIVAVNTVDYEWFEKASVNLNKDNIEFIEFRELWKRYETRN